MNEETLDLGRVPDRRSLPVVRCDLHVHSRHSGLATFPLVGRFALECYSEPGEVYETARRRGMDLVTITDHDSIDGVARLAGRPDVFMSEEVTVELPGERQLHLGVFDLDTTQHSRIQALRPDPEALFAYLAEQRLPACVNHPFSALTGRRETDDLRAAFDALGLVETRNAMLSRRCNDAAAVAARRESLGPCGGSDAHTLASVATAYTCVAGRTRQDFLDGLRRGLTFPAGRSGGYARLTADVMRIAAAACGESTHCSMVAARAALVPLLPLLPLVTAAVYVHEQLFAARHLRLYRETATPRHRMRAPGGVAAGMAT